MNYQARSPERLPLPVPPVNDDLVEGLSVEREVKFFLDNPRVGWLRGLRSPFVVSGWLIPAQSNQSIGIEVEVNGQLRATANTGLRREDVAKAYPDEDGALWSGFAAEVYVDDLVRGKVEIAVKISSTNGATSLARFHTWVRGPARGVSRRQRRWNYADILAWPFFPDGLRETYALFQCRSCG